MLIQLTWWCALLWTSESMVLDPALYLAPSPPLTSPADADVSQTWSQPRTLNDPALAVIPIEQKTTKQSKRSTTTEELQEPTTPPPLTTTAPIPPPASTVQAVMKKSDTCWPGLNPTATKQGVLKDRTRSTTRKALRETKAPSLPMPSTTPSTTTTEQDMMEKSETFWPGLRPTASTGIHLGLRGIHVPLTFGLTGTYGRYGTGGNIGVIGSSYASVDTEDSGLFNLYGKTGLAGSSYGSYGGYGGTRIYGSGGAPSWSGWGNGKWGNYGKGK